MNQECYENNGNKWWIKDGKFHREDGPAKEYADGTKEWFIEGKRHREDGPAIEYADGRKVWYKNDDICARQYVSGDKYVFTRKESEDGSELWLELEKEKTC